MTVSESPLPLILILCTGNVCRSPMAEALMVHRLQQHGLGACVLSRGLGAPVGRAPHPFAIQTAQDNGVPIHPSKRAAAITSPDLASATVVFVMDAGHRRLIQQRYPAASGKTFLLGQGTVGDIVDPIQLPQEAFVTAWHGIVAGTDHWIQQLRQAGMLAPASVPVITEFTQAA